MKKEIYLDNAATTKVHPLAVEAAVEAMTEDYGNPSSLHLKGFSAEKRVKESRETIGEILGADPSNIYFTGCGTESNNMAIIGAALAGKRKGMHIITSELEHASVSGPISYLESQGFEITRIPCDSDGVTRLDLLKNAISRDTVLVSMMYVNNETGAIQPVMEAGNLIARLDDKIVFHVDAIQAVGKLPINLSKSHIDVLSGSGHKFHGPKGCGILYVKDHIKINPFTYGGGQERSLRSGTENVPGICAMAKALSLAEKDREKTWNTLMKHKAFFIKGLSKIENVTINGDIERSSPYILNVTFKDVKSEVLIHSLEEVGIFAGAGSACSSHSKSSSATLLAMGLDKYSADCSLRFSFSADTEKADLEETLKALGEIIPKLRKYQRK